MLDTYNSVHVNDTINVTYANTTTTTSSSPTGGIFGSGTPVGPGTSSTNVSYYWVIEPANNTAQWVTVVAFYGNGDNAVRSSPRYMRSLNSSLTVNTGVVTQLLLIARYSAGTLKYLQWADLGCSGCGGTNSNLCMYVGVTDVGTEAFACAQSNATCSTYLNSTTYDKATNTSVTTSYSPCAFGVYTGFSGTDQYGKPFKSGPQLEMLRKYSVSKLGTSALGYARTAGTYVRSQVPSQVTSTSTSSTQLGRKR